MTVLGCNPKGETSEWFRASALPLLVVLMITMAGAQEVKKEAPPSAGDQSEAEKLIKDVFKEEYAKKTPADRLALAKQFLAKGVDTKDDPKSQFVLLREARDLAAQAGDAFTAMAAIDELARRFSIDSAAMQMATLAVLSKNAKTPEEVKYLVGGTLKLVDFAIAVDDYDAADKLMAAAVQTANRIPEASVTNKISAKSRVLTEFKAKYAKIRKAKESLATNPEDAASNLAVGSYYCLTKGDWVQGLPLLAKSPESPLRATAERELGNPSDAEGQMALADAWWEMAEKESSGSKEVLRDHAAQWYEKASGSLSGLNKTKVDRRLSELRMATLTRGNWVDMTDFKLFNVPGRTGDAVTLEAKPGNLLSCRMQFPKGDYDGVSVKMTLDPKNPCSGWFLYDSPNGYAVIIDSDRKIFVNARGSGNMWNHDFVAPWHLGEESQVTLLLVDGVFIVYLNGREMTRVRSSKPRLSYLGLEARGGTVKYEKILFRRAE